MTALFASVILLPLETKMTLKTIRTVCVGCDSSRKSFYLILPPKGIKGDCVLCILLALSTVTSTAMQWEC